MDHSYWAILALSGWYVILGEVHTLQYFAKIAKGFKSGGYNTTAIQPAFKPESLWSYEVGFKRNLASWNTRIHGNLFYYDYEDIQLLTVSPDAPGGTFPIIINAAEATIRGLEAGFETSPKPNLIVSGDIALLNARFDKFVSVNPNEPTSNPDRSGNRLPQAPDLALSIAASYRWNFSKGDLSFGTQYRYQSSVFYDPFEDPAVKQKGFGLLNVTSGWRSQKGNWESGIYINNVFDKTYSQTIIRQDPTIGTGRLLGAPRTFGLRVDHRFF